jgi:glutamate-5-semialdehyde dehydrogenase
MKNIEKYVKNISLQAKESSRILRGIDEKTKNAAIQAMADEIDNSREDISKNNSKDINNGKKEGLHKSLIDRLELTSSRVDAMIDGLLQIIKLDDPVGKITDLNTRPSGIKVAKMRVPLGVIGIIYESRPNVTADASGLCIKAGNAVILRGGSEAINSNQAITQCIQRGLANTKLDTHCVQLIETTDRSAVGALLQMSEEVDVIIPRGGKSLIERITKESKIPIIKHLDGICHVYIHEDADLEKAVDIAINSKTQRFGVCNAMETLLVSEKHAAQLLPLLQNKLTESGVEIRGCSKTGSYINDIKKASDEDWRTEYLAPILSVKVVTSIHEAIDHIAKYGSNHTDAIVTEDKEIANIFMREVDSSSVMINASTRFADGFEYGLGAEIGISTDKLHARGPVGLEGLTNQKFIVYGDGHIRK